MKKFLFVSALLATALVQAAEITVTDQIMQLSQYDSVKSQFHIDPVKDTASVRLEVTILTGIDSGGVEARRETYNLQVPGLKVSNGNVTLTTSEGTVACGKMSTSRVLQRPVLKLSGKCKLETEVSSYLDGRRVVVKLVTR
jgi:hypothetical protein